MLQLCSEGKLTRLQAYENSGGETAIPWDWRSLQIDKAQACLLTSGESQLPAEPWTSTLFVAARPVLSSTKVKVPTSTDYTKVAIATRNTII